MTKKILPVLFILLSMLIFSSVVDAGKIFAYAEFDKSGNYVCNPFARSLETNIYIDIVHKINDKMALYLKTNPNSTILQQHDVMMEDQKTWDLYNKSRACISDVIGTNPDNVISLSTNVQQAVAIPEFGMLSPIIMTIVILGSIMIHRKF